MKLKRIKKQDFMIQANLNVLINNLLERVLYQTVNYMGILLRNTSYVISKKSCLYSWQKNIIFGENQEFNVGICNSFHGNRGWIKKNFSPNYTNCLSPNLVMLYWNIPHDCMVSFFGFFNFRVVFFHESKNKPLFENLKSLCN